MSYSVNRRAALYGRPQVLQMRHYLPALYLAIIWLTSNMTAPIGVFDRVPMYIIFTMLMCFFLSLEVLIYCFVLFIVLLFYEVLKSIQPGFEFTTKGFLGIFAFSCIMPVTYFSLISFRHYSAEQIGKWLRLILLAIALPIIAENIVGRFYPLPFKGDNYIFNTPVYSGLFSEPSHVGLALSPFVFILAYDFSQFRKYLGLQSIFGLSVTAALCPSGTLVSVAILAVSIAIVSRSMLRTRVLDRAIGIFLLILFGSLLFAVPELSERLTGVIVPDQYAFETGQNISALVFLKGRQMAEYSIVHFPLGVAFLNMQILVPHSTVSYLTDLLFELNSDDGSSLLFKGVCELGFLFVTFAIVGFILFSRKVFRPGGKSFYEVVILSFEFSVFAHFVRAGSYFTGVLAIGLSALLFGVIFALSYRKAKVPLTPYSRSD